jgi:hypothetical protein
MRPATLGIGALSTLNLHTAIFYYKQGVGSSRRDVSQCISTPLFYNFFHLGINMIKSFFSEVYEGRLNKCEEFGGGKMHKMEDFEFFITENSAKGVRGWIRLKLCAMFDEYFDGVHFGLCPHDYRCGKGNEYWLAYVIIDQRPHKPTPLKPFIRKRLQ